MNLKNKLRSFVLGGLLGLSGLAIAATFNLFSPATGILKGSSSTYVTTAAASTDVIGLWTGTCNSGTFLRADGSCQTPSGTGVTSVALTMPSGFSVSGSPVTSTGTFGVTTSLNGPLRGNGSGFTTGNTSLTSEVTGTLPVTNGGIGVATLTGIAKGNGTSAFTAATSADVIGLWTGTCNSGTFLRADGSCQSPGGGGTVTSVDLTMPGIFNVTGNPITSSGTLAVAASGTSGGIPYFSGSTTLASSAVLTADRIVLGGGAATAPTVLGSLGTTTTVLHGNAAGAPTFGAVSLTADVSGTLPVANGGTGVTSSTGTGSVVLSASPALTGTPTVGGVNVCLADGTNCSGSYTANVYKTGTTSRSSTTSLSADPELTWTPPANGTYMMDFCFMFNGTGAGTGGIKISLNRTSGSQFGEWSGVASIAGAAVTFEGSGIGAAGGTNMQFSFASIATASSRDFACGSGYLAEATTSQAYNVEWAQNSSDSNATNMVAGSFLRFTRIN